jgi:hypothetical protein
MQSANLSLFAHTVTMLRNRPAPLTLRQISEETGLGEQWLSMILRKPDVDPGVKKTQTLYEYLSGKPLLVNANNSNV